MAELLAPAGNMEALVAAISNGCDAVYLGLNRFGARAYANNFNNEEIKNVVDYAHLRGVKIYVTMNTIVFDSELNDAYEQIKLLNSVGVDGVIVQDLALFDHIVKNYPELEAHTSTQMGIDDIEGVYLFKQLGAKRVVLSREVPIDKIKYIKEKTKMPIEIFVHGALCVSYSGNCLMSGLIGYRSGNRGRCVGSCRKKYELINTTTGQTITNSYVLSMKDLNTIDYINDLKSVDSLKIEGRMKEPVYVANVVKQYRDALDGKKINKNNLTKTFNRTFTKGYIFGEDKKYVSNVLKPNNFGYLIGKITKITKYSYEITLDKELNQNDIIRIEHNNEDVNLTVAKMYDKDDRLISSSNKICYIKIKEKLSVGDLVYKTKDSKYQDELLQTFPKEFRRFNINLDVYGGPESSLSITAECDGKTVYYESDFMLDKALNKPTNSEDFINQFNRLNDTVYALNDVNYYIEDCFIPKGKINEIRRKIVELLNEARLPKRQEITVKTNTYEPIGLDDINPDISVFCTTKEQYQAAKDLGVKTIYFDNVIRRNEVKYKPIDGTVLVGGYGGVYTYKNQDMHTDFSLNVVNSESVYKLHKLGASTVCISHEINLDQIKDLVNNYKEKTTKYANLEMIIYGRADMMFTTYCPLKVFDQCGKCKKNNYVLKEEYGQFPIISHEDCTTTILNGKVLNLIDDIDKIPGISLFRINLTLESYEESKKIIENVMNKLADKNCKNTFNSSIDTRGHFNKEIL